MVKSLTLWCGTTKRDIASPHDVPLFDVLESKGDVFVAGGKLMAAVTDQTGNKRLVNISLKENEERSAQRSILIPLENKQLPDVLPSIGRIIASPNLFCVFMESKSHEVFVIISTKYGDELYRIAKKGRIAWNDIGEREANVTPSDILFIDESDSKNSRAFYWLYIRKEKLTWSLVLASKCKLLSVYCRRGCLVMETDHSYSDIPMIGSGNLVITLIKGTTVLTQRVLDEDPDFIYYDNVIMF